MDVNTSFSVSSFSNRHPFFCLSCISNFSKQNSIPYKNKGTILISLLFKNCKALSLDILFVLQSSLVKLSSKFVRIMTLVPPQVSHVFTQICIWKTLKVTKPKDLIFDLEHFLLVFYQVCVLTVSLILADIDLFIFDLDLLTYFSS